MPRTQAHRPIAVATPLGEDKVLLKSFTATEQISRPFRVELELLSEDGAIAPLSILGQRVTVRVALANGDTRYFNGHVARWHQTTPAGGQARYRATLVPWLWLLTRNANCRVFQEKSITDIVQEIFRDHGFSDFQLKLNSSYDPLEYCVQYRETDFNFVSRLLEQAGIYYYFKHENGKHTLILADSASAHQVNPKYDEITYHAPDRVIAGREFITDWAIEQSVQTGKFVHTDFDFTKPDTNLEARSQSSITHAGSKFEVFDFPGEYTAASAGENLAKVRMEEMQADHEVARGESDSRGLVTGCKFKLKGFPRHDQNEEWLITSTTIHAESDSFEGGGASSNPLIYRCSFSTIKATTQFRPPRVTPKPLISGPQTAIVSGKAGEEIWTDKHGRVKVQFHWDRAAKADENTSCWLRVAQSWAGKKYGAMFIPRVGHEVVVEFLEGDPDRPLVTGCVYNAREAPAYTLPEHMTKSGIKSNSSKGGGGFNEIRFEDKKGEEQVFIHAEKQLDVRVKENAILWTGKDRHEIVVENSFVDVKKNYNEKVGENYRRHVVGNDSLKVDGKSAIEIAGANSITVKGDMVEVFKANHSETTTGSYYLKATSGLVIECSAGITLKAGGNYVVIDSSGVTIKGSVVTLDGGMTNINSGPGSPAASGSAGSAAAPEAVDAALEAALADPGENSAVQARNIAIVAQQSETATTDGLTDPDDEEKKEEPKTWYEVQVIDAAHKPVRNEPITINLKDGKSLEKKTDGQGVVRLENVAEGDVISYELPERKDEEWDNLGAGKRRNGSGGGESGQGGAQSDESHRPNHLMEETGSEQKNDGAASYTDPEYLGDNDADDNKN